jgi:uncharacterized membrane protein
MVARIPMAVELAAEVACQHGATVTRCDGGLAEVGLVGVALADVAMLHAAGFAVHVPVTGPATAHWTRPLAVRTIHCMGDQQLRDARALRGGLVTGKIGQARRATDEEGK